MPAGNEGIDVLPKSWSRAGLATFLLLSLSSWLPAELLEGRLFLGPGLSIHLEKDEGMFTEMLRALSLVDGEVPVIDLKSLEISREHLFLGTDGNVYLRDDDDFELHGVGTWSSPGHIRLHEGVELRASRSTDELFEGETQDALHVRLSSDPRPVSSEVEVAGIEFWLEHLAEAYIPGGMTRSEESELALVIHALMGALPTDASPTAEEAEHLKQFKGWVENHRLENLEALEPILREILLKLRGGRVDADGDLSRSEREMLTSLTGFYAAIESTIRSRISTD